jgi:hypothetical protein
VSAPCGLEKLPQTVGKHIESHDRESHDRESHDRESNDASHAAPHDGVCKRVDLACRAGCGGGALSTERASFAERALPADRF